MFADQVTFCWLRQMGTRQPVQDGKVVVEYNGSEYGITDDLIRQWVEEKDIVLAFLEEPEVAAAA